MRESESHWNSDEWLARCAWCAQVIPENHEVFALKAKVRPEAARMLQPGKVHPLFLSSASKTIPIIIPAANSEARREGVGAIFQVCSMNCGHLLQQALRLDLGIDETELARPGQPTSPPQAAKTHAPPPSPMKKLIRQVRRLLEEKNLESPEEIDECIKKLDLSPDSELFSQPVSPLEQAEDLVREAWDLPSRKRRCNLAKRALEISPDCADAYLLLAEEETSRTQKAKDLYQKAVAAAERIIGPGMLRDARGHFWGIPETRPYMRARASLAQFLWETGERDAAIDHYHALIELNPNDNQGLRYILAGWLLEEGRDDDLEQLLKRFPDDIAATWQYDRALHLFRQEGPGKKAQKVLRNALKQNPFVPDYLLGEKQIPRSLPALVGIGDENEAIDYADRAIPNWEKTPYALDWLRENTPTADS